VRGLRVWGVGCWDGGDGGMCVYLICREIYHYHFIIVGLRSLNLYPKVYNNLYLHLLIS